MTNKHLIVSLLAISFFTLCASTKEQTALTAGSTSLRRLPSGIPQNPRLTGRRESATLQEELKREYGTASQHNRNGNPLPWRTTSSKKQSHKKQSHTK